MTKFISKKLKNRTGVWRVDGVSKVSDNGRLGVGVTVQFSGIRDSEIHDPYRGLALTGEQFALPTHSSRLTEYKVGSIWKDGELAHSPPLHEHLLTIDVSQCRIVELDKMVKIEGRLIDSVIPENQFRLGNNRVFLAKSRYALVPVLNSTLTNWLIIPCSELLRFYYGVSSRLLSSTLRGRLDEYVSWEESSFEDGQVILRVKQRLSRKEAAVLSRAVASAEAKTAMFGIHKHLAAIRANNGSLNENDKKILIINAGFPFSDQTTLTVAGKAMKLAGAVFGEKNNQWGFLAMQILRCPHSFGFYAAPKIVSDEPFQDGSPTQGGAPVVPCQYPFIEEPKEELEIVDTPANARLKRLSILNFTNQFGAMDNMRFQHIRPSCGKGPIKTGGDTGVPIDALSFSEGSYSEEAKKILGAGTFQHQVVQIDRDLTLFLQMIRCMRTQVQVAPLHWLITTRPLFDSLVDETGKDRIATFPACSGKGRTWHKIVGTNGETRPRQVIIAEFHAKVPGYFYLLEMELKAGQAAGQCTILLHSNNLAQIENKHFETLLNLTTIQNRWIAPQNKWKNLRDSKNAKEFFSEFRMHRINHPHIPRKKNGRILV